VIQIVPITAVEQTSKAESRSVGVTKLMTEEAPKGESPLPSVMREGKKQHHVT
jgi:hypothetical protein